MRILHVANAYTPHSGGIRTTVHALGHGYRSAGHEFLLVVPGPRAADEQLPWGRRIVLPGPQVPTSGGYRVLARPRTLRALLDRLEPDRLEVSDRTTLRGLGTWARSAGVPSVVIAHERLDGLLRAFTPLGERGARWAADRHNATTAQRFDRVVATTRFAAREFDRIGVPTDHVPLGVDLEQFRPSPRQRPRDAPVLVLCSRLSREKRPDLAVAALSALRDGGVEASLVVAGAGPLARSLQRQARGLPVELLGHVADRTALAGLLGGADVVLAPGPVETFGLAALEALASGTPVVAASTSAVAELVDLPGPEGAPPGRSAAPEPAALAGAVMTLLAVPQAQRRRAARARAEQFPWSRTTERMLALHGLAAAPASPRPGLEGPSRKPRGENLREKARGDEDWVNVPR